MAIEQKSVSRNIDPGLLPHMLSYKERGETRNAGFNEYDRGRGDARNAGVSKHRGNGEVRNTRNVKAGLACNKRKLYDRKNEYKCISPHFLHCSTTSV